MHLKLCVRFSVNFSVLHNDNNSQIGDEIVAVLILVERDHVQCHTLGGTEVARLRPVSLTECACAARTVLFATSAALASCVCKSENAVKQNPII
jgi:hypothetical protein